MTWCAGAATAGRQWPEPAAAVRASFGASDAHDDALRHDALPCSSHAGGPRAGIPADAATHTRPCGPAAGAPTQQWLCRLVQLHWKGINVCMSTQLGLNLLKDSGTTAAKTVCIQAEDGCAGFQAFNPRMRGEGGGAAGEGAVRGRQPQVRVRMVQVNLRALLQLAVVAIILYQVRRHSQLLFSTALSLSRPASSRAE